MQDSVKVNAILFARYADRMADNISKITGKKYTAEDYMRERTSIVADATEVDAGGLNQLGEVDLDELEAQKEAVREKYQDTAEWMKAPNGEDTNLTEDQWLTVRTKAFKRWFGNWNYNENEVLEVVDITGAEMLDDDNKPIDIYTTEELSEWLRANLQGSSVVVDSDGSVVNFYRRGLESGVLKARVSNKKKETNVDKNTRMLYAKLSEVIKKSVYFDFKIADARHAKKYYGVEDYYSFLRAGDQFYKVNVILNVHQNLGLSYKGHKTYKIEIKEIEPTVYRDFVEKTTSHARVGSISTISIGELMQGVKPKESSKVLDENGEPLVVYHGSDAEFDVFDREKTRANMDIQGNFFSPWEDDAQGYGENVRAFWLNIKNPASSSVGYKALNKFKGQNGAGIKAREYLISQGYDGVNNDNEEYVAFYPEQIKSTYNIGTFDIENPNVYNQTAYHGSPHTFDTFDLGAIGTNEGTQAHGRVLYFAQDRKVASGHYTIKRKHFITTSITLYT